SAALQQADLAGDAAVQRAPSLSFGPRREPRLPHRRHGLRLQRPAVGEELNLAAPSTKVVRWPARARGPADPTRLAPRLPAHLDPRARSARRSLPGQPLRRGP